MLASRFGVATDMDDLKNNVPSFIGKLALMLKDKSATHLCAWSHGGERTATTGLRQMLQTTP